MEPDVIRMYSSSPPPMDDDDEDNEFGDFGTFSAVPNSISFSEFDTPTTFNQSQALTATSPPELLGGRGVAALNRSNGANGELSKANGVAPASHTERTETKKVLAGSLDYSASDTSGSEPAAADCNGGGTEALTNGFAALDVQGSPSSQNSVQSHIKGTSTEDTGESPEDNDFADFAAFSDNEGNAGEDSDDPVGGVAPAEAASRDERCTIEQEMTLEDDVRDTNRTGSGSTSEAPDGSCNTDRGADADSQQRDVAFAQEAACTNRPCTLNGVGGAEDGDDSKEEAAAAVALASSEGDLSPDGKGSGNETETETETSLGRPLSTEALEEFGDISTTGSMPSPPLHGETPADHSQLAEDDDEDFGDFGDAGSFGAQGFADFEQLDVAADAAPPPEAQDEDDFGDFNSPKFHGNEGGGGEFADFPVSDSFGNFSSAVTEGDGGETDAGWSAFGEQPQEEKKEEEEEEESWAAFSTEPSVVPPPAESREEEEEEEEEWHESEPPAGSEESSRTDRQSTSLSSRLEKLFLLSFPPSSVPPVEDRVLSLRILLGPPEDEPRPKGHEEETPSPRNRSAHGDGVWTQLRDIHEALGLRYQWGGSYCNKALLCCLGIDTRNILFTGQKKQPVIVPMYAASLGMLEPTKEPVKPVSAAEMIASIAQTPPPVPEKTSCPSDAVQVDVIADATENTDKEALPPVQFDWSSSGLTNPLDGVDPELYELTTAKLDSGGGGSRVADAFARLMSTMEKTSTSTRKPRREENLSEEASTVISSLPDLSFMQAKVLMFPTTLTPLGSQPTPD